MTAPVDDTPNTVTLTESDRDDLSLAIVDALRTLGEASATAERLGADVRGLHERRARYLALHRLVLGGAS